MKKWLNISSLVLAAALIWGHAPVSATPITQTFDFNATNFNFGGGPVDPVIGSATVTFDPMGPQVTNQTVGIILNSLNINLGSAISFGYNPSLDRLTIGGLNSGAGTIVNGTDDFYMQIEAASTAMPGPLTVPVDRGFGYTQVPSGLYKTRQYTITIPTSSVPEPSTLALLSLAVAGLGLVPWRRRKTVNSYASG